MYLNTIPHFIFQCKQKSQCSFKNQANFKFSLESRALSSVESMYKVFFKLSKTQILLQIQNIFKCWEQVQICFQIKERSHVPPQIWQSSSSSSHQTKLKVFKSNKVQVLKKSSNFSNQTKLMQFEVVIVKEITSIQICNSNLEYLRARIEHKNKNLKFPKLLFSILKHIFPPL